MSDPPGPGTPVVRMRAAVAETVRLRGAELRRLSASGLVGLLAASALSPVIAAACGAGAVVVAGAGVAGSVGANLVTDLVRDTVARLRGARGGAVPEPEAVTEAVSRRIEAAFAAGAGADRGLRTEIAALFRAVDVTGTAFAAARNAGDTDLASALAAAFVDLTELFGEFSFALVSVRLAVDDLRQQVRHQAAEMTAERERRRDLDAGLVSTLQRLDDRLAVMRRPDAESGSRTPWEGCPYLGLLPFDQRHRTIFYGRRHATANLLARAAELGAAGGWLLVVGASGAGKSSLLRAGLLNGVADGRLTPGSSRWPRRCLTPTADPLGSLAAHLADLAGVEALSVRAALAERPEEAHLLVRQLLTGAEEQRLVLVVDQFEELFTLGAEPSDRDRFVTALQSIADRPVLAAGLPGAVVVVAVRGDFLDQALAYEPVQRAVAAGPFVVGAMTEVELREAITGPAAAAGVHVAPELTATILADLRDRASPTGYDSGSLPMLSQLLYVMWSQQPDHPPGDRMTVAGYHRAGGLGDIVRRSAEEVHAALDAGLQDASRAVFLRLSRVTDGRLTRRPATRAALHTAVGDRHRADAVVEAFAGRRLVVVDDDTVAIAHEELLRSWPALRDWLQPDATDQALHRAFVDDVQAWLDHGRHHDYLYRGGQLLAVSQATGRWARQPQQHLKVGPEAAAFLAASQRRARRSRRTYQAVAAGFAVLATMAAGAAVIADRNATSAADNAAEAARQHATALSRQLAAQSSSVKDTDRLLAEQLAAAALAQAPTREATAVAAELLTDYSSVLPHPAGVADVAFSPDGRRLAAANDFSVQLWDLTTATPLGEPLTGNDRGIGDVAFSPDARLVATGGYDDTVQVWDTTTGHPVGEPLTGHTDVVNAVAFAPDGRLLASASDDESVRLWDPATGRAGAGPLRAGHGRVAAVAFSASGDALISTTKDGWLDRWDPVSGRLVGSVRLDHEFLFDVAFSTDARWMAVVADDAVRVWDTANGRSVGRPVPKESSESYVVLTPDGRRLAVADATGKVGVWDVGTGQPIGTPGRHRDRVVGLAFSPDGERLASGGADKTVRLWNATTGAPSAALADGVAPVLDVTFSPDGRLLAAAGGDGRVRLWDAATGRLLSSTLLDAGDRDAEVVEAVAFSPDGRELAATGRGGTVLLRDLGSRAPTGTRLADGRRPMHDVAFSPDGRLLATADHDGSVRLWDPRTGEPVGRPLISHREPVNAVAFAPDGRLLVSVSDDWTLQLWDPASGQPVGELIFNHFDAVLTVAFAPDGRRFVTASTDRTARLWDVTSHDLVRRFNGHEDAVNGAAFSPDGALVGTGGDDGTVRLWNPATGEHVGAPLLVGTSASAVAFSPDGRLLAAAAGGGKVLLSNPAIYRDPLAALCAQARDLRPWDWERYAAGEPPRDSCP